jgi:hypothetical protein
MFSTAFTRNQLAEGSTVGQGKTAPTGPFRLIDRATGEGAVVSCDDVVRIVGVEIDYIVQTILDDGVFKNGRWRVSRAPDQPSY